jgi:hypothetical protein
MRWQASADKLVGAEGKGARWENKVKVRRQSCEEDERCFIDGGQALGAIKAARGALTPNGGSMRTLSRKW